MADLAPSGYDWCKQCEMHWAFTIVSLYCPVCDPDGIYEAMVKKKTEASRVDTRYQDDYQAERAAERLRMDQNRGDDEYSDHPE